MGGRLNPRGERNPRNKTALFVDVTFACGGRTMGHPVEQQIPCGNDRKKSKCGELGSQRTPDLSTSA
jgi:hypothetical protein